MREYIRRFSRQCNELPGIADGDVVTAFLSGMTCETLVHKLGRKRPKTTKELLDITTNHASGEEAIGAIFQSAPGKAKRSDDVDEGPSSRPSKKGQNRQRRDGSLVAAVDRKGSKPTGQVNDHFEKMLEQPCLNHATPVKHLLKDYRLMKRFLFSGAK